MSHVAKINLEIHDLEALAATAKALGMTLVKNQQTYRWYGKVMGDYPLPEGFKAEDMGKCEHALRLNTRPMGVTRDPYEIGIVKRRDGKPGYTLLWDFWQGGFGLEAAVGKDGNKLKQQYAVQVGKRWAAKNGMRVTSTVKEDGRIVLRASKS